MKAELQVFIALTPLITDRETVLLATVADGDHAGRLVDTALELALVPARLRVGVGRVQRRVASLAKRAVGAVAAVNSVQEVVQEAVEGVVVFIWHIVGLEEYAVLRPDDRVRNLEVEVGLKTSVRNADRSDGTIDSLQDWVRAVANARIVAGEERVEITLAVDVTEVLEDTKLISLSCLGALRDVVHSLGTVRTVLLLSMVSMAGWNSQRYIKV